MINALVVVGNHIKYNVIFMEYLEREVCQKLGHLDALYHLDKNESNLSQILEEILQKSQRVVIATKEGYGLVGKILCSLSGDSMILKEGVLMPSRAIEAYHDSYLISYQESLINVLEVGMQSALPPIMIAPLEQGVHFYLVDVEDAQMAYLDNIAQTHNVNVSQTELIKGLVFVNVSGFLHAQQDAFIQALAFAFEEKVLFGRDLAEIISERLIACGKKVTTVESCTGGLIASEIVKNAGVSTIFDGAIVSYANAIKSDVVDVKEQTLLDFGAVSVQTVYEMMEGALNLMESDMVIAVSGIAGPSGGSTQKPVGTVYIGAKSRGGETLIEHLRFQGDRNYIQKQAVLWGFKLLSLSDKKTFFNFVPKKLDN